jgi:acetylornithine deacetylase/succinyl-diaminopimelate desuccinylase-like protein
MAAIVRAKRFWRSALALLGASLACCSLWVATGTLRGADAADASEAVAAAEARLTRDVQYLASDELEGRGPGTRGIDLAADYIAAQFREAGLQTELFDGSPFQTFTITLGSKLGEPNEAQWVAPDGTLTPLKLGESFTPLSLSGSGRFELPLVFVGYGITAPDLQYDDYAGLDVKGKAVIILRKEPQQENPHSKFDGTQATQHATFMRKVSNAYQNGAAAVVFVNDEVTLRQAAQRRVDELRKAIEALVQQQEQFAQLQRPTLAQIAEHAEAVARLEGQIRQRREALTAALDTLIGFTAGDAQGRDLPVLAVTRRAIEPVVQAALGKSLADLEREIDQDLKPRSAVLNGWSLRGHVNVQRTDATVKNVVGVLPPDVRDDPQRASETIVIGAHYDHLGYGGPGSFVPNQRVIHNGADDNGSGTVALLELARRLSQTPNRTRRFVFIAFTAEERGLYGSAHYVRHPLVEMKHTIAMLNLDMVGRMTDDRLIIQGIDTSTAFGPLIDELNKTYQFKITRQKGGTGPSDHSSFYTQGVPVMHFFTGTHKDYHRPTDTAEKLNVPGMRRVVEMVYDIAVALDRAPQRPDYVKVQSAPRVAAAGDRPYLGTIPAFDSDLPGYTLMGVTENGPAAKAGLKGGDSIIRFGDFKIGGLEDIDGALRKYKAGDKVKVVVLRDGKELELEVVLGEPR